MSSTNMHAMVKTTLLTGFALLAFAANSLLCRMALVAEQGSEPALSSTSAADPYSFTLIRLASGAAMLGFLLFLRDRSFSAAHTGHGRSASIDTASIATAEYASWLGAISLFVYAICFSLAYVQLDTGTGALILFGAVQVSMILLSLLKGHRLTTHEITGLVLATSGLVYLVLPNLGTPSIQGFLLMALSGIAWGVYSLAGSGSQDSLRDTSVNFAKTLPFMVCIFAVVLLLQEELHLMPSGWLYSLLSGALASGVGYAVWYKVLPFLSPFLAAMLMLLVPLIAAAGGILFLGESLSLRFIVAAALIIGGVVIVILKKK